MSELQYSKKSAKMLRAQITFLIPNERNNFVPGWSRPRRKILFAKICMRGFRKNGYGEVEHGCGVAGAGAFTNTSPRDSMKGEHPHQCEA
jgi:hypothetical protein